MKRVAFLIFAGLGFHVLAGCESPVRQVKQVKQESPLAAAEAAPRPWNEFSGKPAVATVVSLAYYPEINLARWSGQSRQVPAGGWQEYDATQPAWAERELKRMMASNIDLVFLEVDARAEDPALQDEAHAARLKTAHHSFLEQYAAFLKLGWRPPALAQWVNTEAFTPQSGEWDRAYPHLDLARDLDRQLFFDVLIAPFWRRVFSALGPEAPRSIARMDRKVLISIDTARALHMDQAFFVWLKARFQVTFGVSPFLLGPAEELPEIHAYDDSRFVLPPQDQGLAPAWRAAFAARPSVRPLLITFWNSFVHGNAVAPTETGPAMTASSLEIMRQAASFWTDATEHDAEFVWMRVPARMAVGQPITLEVAVRNRGSSVWSAANRLSLALVTRDDPFETREVVVDDLQGEGSESNGIFRGQVKVFRFSVTPRSAGVFRLQWRMSRPGGHFFGKPTPIQAVRVFESEAVLRSHK